jgi:hypothetical protein
VVRGDDHKYHHQDYNNDNARRRSITSFGTSPVLKPRKTGGSDFLSRKAGLP